MITIKLVRCRMRIANEVKHSPYVMPAITLNFHQFTSPVEGEILQVVWGAN